MSNEIKQDDAFKVIVEDMNFFVKKGVLNPEDFKDKRFLLTGSTGYLINYLGKLLISLNKAFSLNMKIHLHGRSLERLYYRFGKDIFDKDIIPETFSLYEPFPTNMKFDYIIHGASPANSKAVLNDPVGVILPNVLGTKNALEYAKTYGAKVLFTSSVSIYGNLNHISKKRISEKDLGVTDPIDDRACYEESKKMGENMCFSYFKEYGVKSSSVRIPFSYGPTCDLSVDTRVIPRTIKKIITSPHRGGGKISLFEDFRPLQSSYVGDVATGILYVLFKGENGEVYNICSDHTMTLQDMVQILIDNSNTDIELELKKDNGDYYFKDNAIVFLMDNNKLKSLGWKESCDFNYGLRQTIRGYSYF